MNFAKFLGAPFLHRTPPVTASEIGKNKKKIEYFETGKRKK